MNQNQNNTTRRGFLTTGAAATLGVATLTSSTAAKDTDKSPIVTPPTDRRILLSCKLGMIAKKIDGKELSLTEQLKLAKEAGFDGVDFDRAGNYTPEQARAAVQESGVFVHNAINHAHWSKRLTSPKPEDREAGRKNIEHCIRVSHAGGAMVF